MRALIITWTNFQDQEVVYPYYRLLGANFDVKIAADNSDAQGRFYGIMGVNMPCHYMIGTEEVCPEEPRLDFRRFDPDLLVLPGGVKALEKLRQKESVLRYIAEFYATGKTIASTCHGAQLLISAKVTKGHTIAAYPSIKDDIENSGATWSGDPVVVSRNIVSSPHYDYLGPWMEETISMVNNRDKHFGPSYST